MKLEEIEKILNDNIIYAEILVDKDDVIKEIYKLHLEDKLEMCITLALQSNKGLQTQANIIDKIIAIGRELQQELKTLEGE